MLQLGLEVKDSKTKVWVSEFSVRGQLPQQLLQKTVEELPVLEATLFSHDREDPLTAGMGGADRPMREAAQQIQKAGEVLDKLVAAGPAPQVAGAVLRYMAAGMPQHLLRMKLFSSEALEAYDAAKTNAEKNPIVQESASIQIVSQQTRVTEAQTDC